MEINEYILDYFTFEIFSFIDQEINYKFLIQQWYGRKEV